MRRNTGLGQVGDTLVEVLISILVVSLILTGAYVTTNRSSIGIRNSQEHAEALKLVQSQLEQIRQNATQAAPNVFDRPVGAAFCMVDAAIVTTNPPCQQDAGGAPTVDQPAYKLTIQRQSCDPYIPPAGAICHKFTVSATWDSVTADGRNSEVMTYRLYE